MPDFDNIFKFYTPKYVYIRDAKLGVMRYSLMALIFVYVVVYNIFYTCSHLAPHHAAGFGTISIQHPVADCDEFDKDCFARWHNIGTLPYCSQFTGDATTGDASLRELQGIPAATAAQPAAATAAATVAQTAAATAAATAVATAAPTSAAAAAPTAVATAAPTSAATAAPGSDKEAVDNEDKEEEEKKASEEEKKKASGEEEESAAKEEEEKKASGDVKMGEGDCPDCGKTITKPKMCRYLDNRRLLWSQTLPSEIFVPTHYQKVTQRLNPDCYNPAIDNDDAKTDPSKKFRCKSPYITEKTEEYFVADIEQFTLKLSHSFQSPAIHMHGVSTDYQGLFAACATNHPLQASVQTTCKIAKVPHTLGEMAPEDEVGLKTVQEMKIPSLTGAATGEDTISLGDLLRATPIAQRYERVQENVLDSKLPSDFGHPDKSLREAGGMLLLDINYANDGYKRPGFPFLPASFNMGIKPINYMYRPYFVPMTKNEQFQLVEVSDHASKRVIDKWSGITIKMEFNGELVAFSWAKVLSALTTGLVLLSVAATLVVYIASYLLPMQEKYNGLMFQMSEDMTNPCELRAARVSGCSGFMNPLGLLDSKPWTQMESVFMTGTLLWKYLDTDGKVTKELPNSDIIKILCMNEVRLNRMDAMDTRMTFDGSDPAGEDKHRVAKLIKTFKKTYYDAAKVPNE